MCSVSPSIHSQTTSTRSPLFGGVFVLLATILIGCGQQEFVSLGTAPVGGAFAPVGNAIAETLNEHKGENTWKVQAKGTNGSQDNIRQLAEGDLQLALSNAAITYFAVHGGGDWNEKYDMTTVVTIAPNVAMFITKEDSGIKTIQDLKDKRVVIGPAGAGFEMFVEPILKAHGVEFSDFTVLNNNQNGAVDMLADGQADAAFLGGAIPTSSIQRACSDMAIHFIPFDKMAVERLSAEYPFFWELTVPGGTYSDLDEDFAAMNVGSMHLITSADYDEERVYQLTKTIYENRQDISHPAAKKFINEKNAARYTGTPFHPGAIRYYKEIGIWKGEGGDLASGEASGDESSSKEASPTADATDAPSSESTDKN